MNYLKILFLTISFGIFSGGLFAQGSVKIYPQPNVQTKPRSSSTTKRKSSGVATTRNIHTINKPKAAVMYSTRSKLQIDPKVLQRLRVNHPNALSYTPGKSRAGNNQREEDPDAYLQSEREGPKNDRFILENEVKADISEATADVLKIDDEIRRDGNIKAGYYYFLPESYELGWSENTGEYDLYITYGEATGNGPAPVTITAVLFPKYNAKDIEIAKEILEKKLSGKSEKAYGIKEFMTMPLGGISEIEFNDLKQFGVQEDDFNALAPSQLGDPILLKFTTTDVNRLMLMFFNNIGLFGELFITPDGEHMTEKLRIPLYLKVDDPATFGKTPVKRYGMARRMAKPDGLSRLSELSPYPPKRE